MSVSADAVYAERGGSGNSNGNRGGNSERGSSRSDNGNANRSNNGNANRSVVQQVTTGEGNNGRGVLARELRGLNAAHANQSALENASPNRMPGKLYIYKQEQPELRANQTEAVAELERLTALSSEEIAAEFPVGDYTAALNLAAVNVEELARLDALDAAAIATEYLDGDYAAALAAAADDETELAHLQGLDAFGIVAEFSNDDYVAALEAAAGDPEELARLEALDAAAIAASYPDDAYSVSLTDAGDAYLDTQQAVIDSLLALSGDLLLSDAALAELDKLLGLLE
ncbi:MAG: hypothetical protein ACJAZ1_001361 [Yoonia sp.]|jgi:hypothetical protein